MNFSMNTRSSPNEANPSRRVASNPSRTSASDHASRIPLPPPPALAFIMTG
ncbi:hypothetical protein D3C83_264340 [compost metagenome]